MNSILSAVTYRHCDKPGSKLWMRDGSIWFHPYDGSAPVMIADNDENGQCRHCGRDNRGHESSPCADDCPIVGVVVRS